MLHSKCLNYGNCPNADSKKTIEIEEGAPLVCPDCQERVNLVPLPATMPWSAFLVLFAVLLAASWGVLNLLQNRQAAPASASRSAGSPAAIGMASENVKRPAMESAAMMPRAGADPASAPPNTAPVGTKAAKPVQTLPATGNATVIDHSDTAVAVPNKRTSDARKQRQETSDAGWKVPGN